MGEKDIGEKILASHNDVFADIVNGFLFQGQLSVLGGDRRYEDLISYENDTKEVPDTMCEILDSYLEKGKEEGKDEAAMTFIRALMRSQNIDAETAMQYLSVPEEEQAKYLEAMQQ